MAKAKCKICKTELTNERYSPNGKTPYYCSEGEYSSFNQKKASKKAIQNELNDLLQQIFYFKDGFVPPLVRSKIKNLTNYYTYDIIIECFKQQRQCIENIIRTKEFKNTSHMINYVFAIIGNNIADVKIREVVIDIKDNVDINMLNEVRCCSKAKDISRWI